MKILIVSQNHISIYTGGNEVYADALASQLVAMGHTVDYLTTVGEPGDTSYQLHVVPGKKIGKYVLPSREWFRWVSKLKPDIVHAAGSGIGISLLGLYCKRKRIKCVLTFQAPQRGSWWGRVDENIQIYGYNRLIATSCANEMYLKRKTKKQIETVFLCLKSGFRFDKRLGVKAAREKLNLDQNKKFLIMVAKLDEHHYYKGVETALYAVSKLPKKYQLILVGKGSLLAEYQNKAASLGIRDRVCFLDQVTDEVLPLYYQAADAMILPSTSESEGFGLVLLEAMACGVPTITTSCVGIASYLAKHKLAKVIHPKDPLALAKAIIKPDLDKNQLDLAAKFALSRTILKMTQETELVYKKMV